MASEAADAAAARPRPREQPQDLANTPAAAAAAAGEKSPIQSSVTSLDPAAEQETDGTPLERLSKRSRLRRLWRRIMHLLHGHGRGCPLPIAYPAEGEQLRSLEEDLIRRIDIAVPVEYEDAAEGKHIREDVCLREVKATFDFNFKEGDGVRPVVLINASILGGIPFQAYADPENPPLKLTSPDGRMLKLYGELSGRWAAAGPTGPYDQQRVFLNPAKSIVSRFVVVPEQAPYDVLVSAGTIKANKLDRPTSIVAMIEGIGQGGRHDPLLRVNHDAVRNREPILAAQRTTQARLQRQKEEKKREEAKKRNSQNTKKK